MKNETNTCKTRVKFLGRLHSENVLLRKSFKLVLLEKSGKTPRNRSKDSSLLMT